MRYLPHIPRITRAALTFALALGAIFAAQSAAGVAEDVYWDETYARHQPSGFVDAVVVDGDDMYIGGNVLEVGGLQVNYIARFDGEQWEKLDSGVGTYFMGLVHSIAVSNGVLYAGGMFDQVGIWSTSNIARYDLDTGEWRPLGRGTNRAVRRVQIGPNGDVYVVGEFSEADGQPASGIARWDGNRWYAFGTGLWSETMDKRGNLVRRSAPAMGLAVADNGVYVGGMFNSADDVPCNNVAFWDGTTFRPLGSGLNGLVTIMALYGGQLYVGGQFTQAGGRPAPAIARWDGYNWSSLGAGLGGRVYTFVRWIHREGNLLYVGGDFATSGSVQLNNIGIWDGSTWSPMGSGTDNEVKVMTRYRGALIVGGDFTAAGEKPVPFMTRWVKGVVEFNELTAVPRDDGVDLSWSVNVWAPITAYHVCRSTGDGPFQLVAEVTDLDVRTYFDDSARAGESYTYRVTAVREDGGEVYSPTAKASIVVPAVVLEQNYPNPFNPTTVIEYALPQSAPVLLTIHDVRGKLVRRLVDGPVAAGVQSVVWDGTDDRGNGVGTGVYFYRLATSGEVHTRKMMIVK